MRTHEVTTLQEIDAAAHAAAQHLVKEVWKDASPSERPERLRAALDADPAGTTAKVIHLLNSSVFHSALLHAVVAAVKAPEEHEKVRVALQQTLDRLSRALAAQVAKDNAARV